MIGVAPMFFVKLIVVAIGAIALFLIASVSSAFVVTSTAFNVKHAVVISVTKSLILFSYVLNTTCF